MRRAGHRLSGAEMAHVGAGGGQGWPSAASAAEGSEPDAAPDGESSAPPRPAPIASRNPRPLALRFNRPIEAALSEMARQFRLVFDTDLVGVSPEPFAEARRCIRR